jgi:hydroxymethylpyrimidine pyrophosphatase-like HAD family hydrolase
VKAPASSGAFLWLQWRLVEWCWQLGCATDGIRQALVSRNSKGGSQVVTIAKRKISLVLADVNKEANKGAVVEYLSRHLNVPAGEIATIGDQPTDVLMFKRSGFSIAMGNASDEVKIQADATTASYNDEGFARAMERYILGSAD